MTRNLRNELLTAILVLGGLALALGGVFVLSVSAPSEILPTDVATVVSMVESPVDENPTLSITAQSAVSTETQNATSPTPISPPFLSTSPTRLTETALPSSPIAIAINTTLAPSATTHITNTPIPLSATATIRITNTPIPASPSPTSLPPTTNTPIVPSLTPRPTTTHTPLPPSATALTTNTAIPPSPTANTTTMPIVATNTLTPSGNGSIPFLSLNPLTPEGCLNPSVQISSPIPNNRLSEAFEVIGTAAIPNFGVYHIEIRANNALIYQRIATRQQVVYSDILAEINPSQYPNGIYWIRLVVVDNRGYITENGTCAIPTIFE